MIKADTSALVALARDIAKAKADAPAIFADSARVVAKGSAPAAVQEITAVYNLTQKRIATNVNSRAQGPVIFTFAKARAPSLKEYGGEQVAKGYRAQIKKGGKPRMVRGGFAAAKFGGLPLKRVGKERYPLKVLYGPKISSMLRNREIAPRFATKQAEIARVELTRQMFNRLGRL